jgi:hypothetical protein
MNCLPAIRIGSVTVCPDAAPAGFEAGRTHPGDIPTRWVFFVPSRYCEAKRSKVLWLGMIGRLLSNTNDA